MARPAGGGPWLHRRVVDRAGLVGGAREQPAATGSPGTVEVTSATGYSRRLPLNEQLLLATAIDDASLSPARGAPARLVVPGRRGYHWVKWVVRISHDDRPWWVEPPLPLQ